MTSVTDVLRKSVVVFSKNYLPISQVNIKGAIALLVTGFAEPLDLMGNIGSAGWQVPSASLVRKVPEQIRVTMTGTERIWRVPPANRRRYQKSDPRSRHAEIKGWHPYLG